uniref:Uncharacterized protein n=1 Tax=Octopus bimaculoides TaxID=37653 RepID=A0A0L8I4U1_OCTBM
MVKLFLFSFLCVFHKIASCHFTFVFPFSGLVSIVERILFSFLENHIKRACYKVPYKLEIYIFFFW